VAPELFAKPGRIQESVDQTVVGVGRWVPQEVLDLRGSRREAGEIECRTSDQRGSVGLGIWAEAVVVQSGEDKLVDGITGQPGAPGDGWRRTAHRLVGPKLALRDCVAGADRSSECRRRGYSGIGQAHADPSLEVADLVRLQILLWRHFEVVVDPVNGPDEEAVFGLSEHGGGPGIATGQDGRPRVEQESAFSLGLFGAVAFVAIGDEDGPDALLEELESCRGNAFGGLKTQADREHYPPETHAGEAAPERFLLPVPAGFRDQLRRGRSRGG
jgi:hypothetical protein